MATADERHGRRHHQLEDNVRQYKLQSGKILVSMSACTEAVRAHHNHRARRVPERSVSRRRREQNKADLDDNPLNGGWVRFTEIRPWRSERPLSAHIDRPVPVLRIRNALCYRLHFRKRRSGKNDKARKINTLFKPSFRGPRAVD